MTERDDEAGAVGDQAATGPGSGSGPAGDDPVDAGPGAGPGDGGADAVRAALNRARAAAAAKGVTPGRRPGRQGARATGDRRGRDPRDGRDPQPFGAAIGRLVAERGWSTPVAVGGVMGRWEEIVGAEVSAHCEPESFEDSVLVVRADSTAWATQLRWLSPRILRRLAEELGPDVVKRLDVRAPSGPSWRRGPRSAPGGRGPRDTYG